MYDSRKKSRRRRSRRGGALSALSPASVSGGRRRRSRRSRRGGASPLSPAPVGVLSSARDTNMPYNGIDGAGLTYSSSQGGPLTQALTAGSRSRKSRRDRR